MGYRGQTGSRRGSGEKFQKSKGEKKAKAQKKSKEKYVEEAPVLSAQEIQDKTLGSLDKLSTQIFAVSPFSQYFDDWLVNLREAVAEFESNPSVAADEAFIKERTQLFADVEREFADKRIREAALEESAKTLAAENHHLVELDKQYAEETHALAAKRNGENEPLNKSVHDLEAELDKVKQMKTSFFGFTKKAKARKEAEVTQKLTSAKTQLELALQNFNVEQDKQHDAYEQKKQTIMNNVRQLEKEIENIETDSSAASRKATCDALAASIKALMQRAPAPAAEPAA